MSERTVESVSVTYSDGTSESFSPDAVEVGEPVGLDSHGIAPTEGEGGVQEIPPSEIPADAVGDTPADTVEDAPATDQGTPGTASEPTPEKTFAEASAEEREAEAARNSEGEAPPA